MSKYFEYSQEVRKQIENDSNLMGKLREYYGNDNSDNLESIGSGTSNAILRVGKLDNDLWVALREIFDSKFYGISETYLSRYDSFCKNAEKLSEEGKRVPNFCVGVSCGNGVGLLVEDLTNGGVRDLYIPRGSLGLGKTPLKLSDTDELVYVDLDADNFPEYKPKDMRFMKKENMINL